LSGANWNNSERKTGTVVDRDYATFASRINTQNAVIKEECRDLLKRVGFGRLGCASENQPCVVPIYFAYEPDHLFGFSTAGQKIEWMLTNPLVCVAAAEVISQEEQRLGTWRLRRTAQQSKVRNAAASSPFTAGEKDIVVATCDCVFANARRA
jgi:hypothetical protein